MKSEADGGARGSLKTAYKGHRVGLWQVLALLLVMFVFEQNLEDVAIALNVHPMAGVITAGATLERDPDRLGAFKVVSAQPNSLLAMQGVGAGAELIPDRPLDFFRDPLSLKDLVGVTVVQNNRGAHLQLIPQRRTAAPDWARALIDALLTACLGFSLLIILGSQGRPLPLMLGTALAGFAGIESVPEPLASNLLAVVMTPLTEFVGGLTFIMFMVFALRLHEDATGRRSYWLGGIGAAVSGLVMLAFAASALWLTTGWVLPLVGNGRTLAVWSPQVDFALVLAILVDAYRRSPAEVRQRYGLLLIAFGLVVVCQSVIWMQGPGTSTSGSILLVCIGVSSVLAPALFAYAILKQRVMDVAFVINRTLVYGFVSVILLVGFGLMEWAVEHFFSIQGREKNAFIDASLALIVFLTFHKVRDTTEHIVEALFFRRWHRQEAEFRRFLREAAFITRPEALLRATVKALERFCDETPVAIYMRDEAGDLRRLQGDSEGPDTIDADHPSLVRLRADPKPLELDDDAGLGATLIAPLLNRTIVTGVIMFAPRRDAGAWRPDELALIGQAALQIGQDLQLLQVERLERIATELKQENTLLKQQCLAAS